MTRETRIGLVLGLVFIIAFGMILTEVRQAAEPVRQDEPEPLVTPTYHLAQEPPMEPVAWQPATRQTSRTSELAERPRTTQPSQQMAHSELTPPHRQSPVDEGLAAATMRRQQPQTQTPQPVRRVQRNQPLAPQEAARTHVVAEGENFYRIAERVYGPGKGHLWKRIYEANRATVSNPGQLAIGQRIVIPPLRSANSSPDGRGEGEGSSLAVREVSLEQLDHEITQPQHGVIRMYTVRRGDNLTSIAREQLRDASPEAVRRIIEANPEIDDPDAIRQGMTLKIPNG